MECFATAATLGFFFFFSIFTEFFFFLNTPQLNPKIHICAYLHSSKITALKNIIVKPPISIWHSAISDLKIMKIKSHVQSATKLFEHLQNYLEFFSSLNANFYHFMLVINNIKSNDHELTNIYFIKLH